MVHYVDSYCVGDFRTPVDDDDEDRTIKVWTEKDLKELLQILEREIDKLHYLEDDEDHWKAIGLRIAQEKIGKLLEGE